MNHRVFPIFVSSTFSGHEDARRAAIRSVRDCGHLPIAMEDFPPSRHSNRQVIGDAIRDSSVYVLILGPRYGERPPGEQRSYTHFEYYLALTKYKKPILAFLLNDDDVRRQRQLIPHGDPERANDAALAAFYDEVKQGQHMFKMWRWDEPDEIRVKLIIALQELEKSPSCPRGLVPEPDPDEQVVYKAADSELVRDVIQKIVSFKTLFRRTTKNVHQKARAAEYFAQVYRDRLFDKDLKGVFFESGSSVAFMARAFPPPVWKQLSGQNKHISTNNAFAYLRLWLIEGMACHHFPHGRAEEIYGASYGSLEELAEDPVEFPPKPLRTSTTDHFVAFDQDPESPRKNTSLIFTATSGLQLDHRCSTEGHQHALPDAFLSELARCRGPHVGSFRNKVFKRYLYQTGIPLVLVLDEDKIDCPIDVTKCHFVFDDVERWEKVLASAPLALCIGCSTANLRQLEKRIREHLPTLDRITTTQESKEYSALIATNREFATRFPV